MEYRNNEYRLNLNSNLEEFIFNSLFDLLDESNGYKGKRRGLEPLDNILTIRGEYVHGGVVVEENTIRIYADSEDANVVWVQKFGHFFAMSTKFFYIARGVFEDMNTRGIFKDMK